MGTYTVERTLDCRNKSGNDTRIFAKARASFPPVILGLFSGIQSRSNEAMSFHVYILASRKHGTLYIGVTNDLARRVSEHRSGEGGGFSAKYNVGRLVYVESYDDIEIAIQREKTLKRRPRVWKIRQIERDNPDWRDLFEDIHR